MLSPYGNDLSQAHADTKRTPSCASYAPLANGSAPASQNVGGTPMYRHATVLIAEPWPYRCTRRVANRGRDLNHRPSWTGLVAYPGGVSGPALPCAGLRLPPLVIPPPGHFS